MSIDDQQREPNPRDQALSALYQRGRKDEPPAHLDAQILAAAHREVTIGPQALPTPRRARWQLPLALAATVVLSVTVVSLLREQQPTDVVEIALLDTAPAESRGPAESSQNAPPVEPERLESSSTPVTTPTDVFTAPASPPPNRSPNMDAANAAKPVEDARRLRTQRLDPSASHDASTEPLLQPTVPDTGIVVAENVVQEKKKSLESETDRDVLRLETPATAAATDVPAESSIAMNRLAERTQASGVRTREAAASASPHDAQWSFLEDIRTGEAAAPTSASTASQLKPIEPWLKEIAKLRVEGRIQESALQLQILKRSYPAVADEFINKRLTEYEREWRTAATPDAAPSTKKESQ